MSNLLIEIGNTALKAAFSDGMTLGKTYRYQGEKVMDFIRTILKKDRPGVLVVASVYDISRADEEYLQGECQHLILLDPSHRSLLSSYSLPSYLSYDRAASILAARYLFRGKGCTIVDFGTTLTFDYTDGDGTYQGGSISLGCRTRFKALNRYSKVLPLLNSPEMKDIPPLSLEGSMVTGVVSGILFEIEGYTRLNPENIVVFTGGDANFFAKRMKISIFVICNLVLMGLALIADNYVRKMDK